MPKKLKLLLTQEPSLCLALPSNFFAAPSPMSKEASSSNAPFISSTIALIGPSKLTISAEKPKPLFTVVAILNHSPTDKATNLSYLYDDGVEKDEAC